MAALLVLGWLITFAPQVASAHSGVQSYLYIDVTDEGLGGRVEMPFGDLRDVLGLGLQGTDEEVLDELRRNEDLLTRYVEDHMTIGDDASNWSYDVIWITLLEGEGGYAVVHFLVDVPYAEVPRVLEVGFDPFFDEIDDRTALILIGNDWKGGIIENGESVLLGFDPDNRARTIDLGSASQWNNFTASIGQGVDHIETGPDHVLFVAVLLLPSVLVFTTRWQPADSFGSSLWRILKIVSMFTLAHSITFVLAGIDVIPLPPSRLVETVIALSIAVTALHNLRPVFPNREWSIAFVFGLFHGMGFAGFVQGLDLNQTTKLVSLLGRNVGIEIGQAVVVVLVFPAMFALRRTIWYRPLFTVSSVALAVVALLWMIERLFEVDLRVSRLIDPAIEMPRAIVVVAVLTVIAVLIREVEARAGRLLPTAGQEHTPVADEPELVAAGDRASGD
ncbi:MAG: HupE/UreJ family protein [Ilumatobacter sp.]|nr:HupE/UreJ family protein [Ilumatobacter sp.]